MTDSSSADAKVRKNWGDARWCRGHERAVGQGLAEVLLSRWFKRSRV